MFNPYAFAPYVLAGVAIVVSYLIGSVSFAVIMGNIFAKKDVRKFGSGNAGMTNVMRVAGVVPGILTFVCDFLKCCLACYIGQTAFGYAHDALGAAFFSPHYGAWLCGMFCLFGHVFPIFFKFKGGKAVASGFGLMVYCCPLAALIAFASFVIVFVITRIISAASVTAAVVCFIAVLIINFDHIAVNATVIVCAAIISSLVLIKHKDNIKRLLKGEEKKFKIKK